MRQVIQQDCHPKFQLDDSVFSMTPERWRQQKEGIDCPFCSPRQDDNQFWLKVESLSISTLYLQRVQTYRGYSVLVYDRSHATVPSQLSADEWVSFCKDLHVAQAAIEKVTNPDHMNVAALGNQIAHLHWHIFPRYENDSRWGGPVWTNTEEEMEIKLLPDTEHQALAGAIRAAICGAPIEGEDAALSPPGGEDPVA